MPTPTREHARDSATSDSATDSAPSGTGPTPDVPALDGLRLRDVPRVGGKGANLGELLAAGLPVPPGFVVSADAYLAAMDAAGVRDRKSVV